MDPRERLGERVRQLRKILNLTQEGLAARVGMQKLAVVRIEKGLVWPEFKSLESLAHALKASIDDLVDPQRGPLSPKTELVEMLSTFNDSEAKDILAFAKDVKASRTLKASKTADDSQSGHVAKDSRKP